MNQFYLIFQYKRLFEALFWITEVNHKCTSIFKLGDYRLTIAGDSYFRFSIRKSDKCIASFKYNKSDFYHDLKSKVFVESDFNQKISVIFTNTGDTLNYWTDDDSTSESGFSMKFDIGEDEYFQRSLIYNWTFDEDIFKMLIDAKNPIGWKDEYALSITPDEADVDIDEMTNWVDGVIDAINRGEIEVQRRDVFL